MTEKRERKTRLSGALAQRAKIQAEPGRIIPLVKEHLQKHYTIDPDRATDVIHPSEIAKANWCPKATYLRITGQITPALEPFDFVRSNIFREGSTIHDKWQRWLRDTGKLWGDWECGLCGTVVSATTYPGPWTCIAESDYLSIDHQWVYKEVALHNDELIIAGHADGAVDDGLVEFKSVGLGTVRIDAPDFLARYQDGTKTDLPGLWRGLVRPFRSHILQGDIYLWLAQQAGLPFKYMTYVYEFKATQQVKEFTLELDIKRLNPYLDKARAIAYAVRGDGPSPECPVGGCELCTEVSSKPKRTLAE